MLSKRNQRDALIDFANTFSVKPDKVNARLAELDCSPLKQTCKLHDLIVRPQLNMSLLMDMVPELSDWIDVNIERERRDEIVECAEILIKYQGYIERERLIADKIHRLEDVKLGDRIDYDSVKSISTEARQKLKRIAPETIAQASRIPGISPSDINILLLLLGR